MLKPALLILILASDGGVQMTLSTAEDANHCEDLHGFVTEVLDNAGYTRIAALCGQTALRVTPFEHGATPEDEVHRYRVSLAGDDGFQIAPLGQGETCQAAPQADPAIWCARSSQAVLDE